jgi:hypothetical protein
MATGEQKADATADATSVPLLAASRAAQHDDGGAAMTTSQEFYDRAKKDPNAIVSRGMTEWTPPEGAVWDATNFEGLVPESWRCIDCGFNTAPGCLNRAEMEQAAQALGKMWETTGIKQHIDNRSEIYTVRKSVWAKAGVPPMGGCLCIGCLEKRIGRRLRSKDFQRNHPFNSVPGTPRLLERRGAP